MFSITISLLVFQLGVIVKSGYLDVCSEGWQQCQVKIIACQGEYAVCRAEHEQCLANHEACKAERESAYQAAIAGCQTSFQADQSFDFTSCTVEAQLGNFDYVTQVCKQKAVDKLNSNDCEGGDAFNRFETYILRPETSYAGILTLSDRLKERFQQEITQDPTNEGFRCSVTKLEAVSNLPCLSA